MFSTGRVGTGGALSTGKVEKVRTGGAVSAGAALSTSCSGLGVRMPKMDIEDRNMVAGVCGFSDYDAWSVSVSVWVSYIRRVSLVEHVCCVLCFS